MTISRLIRIGRLRLRALVRAREIEAEIDREFGFHLQQLAEEKAAEGLSPDAAVRAARLEFGNPAAFAERSRDMRGLTWLDDLRRDVRYGWRMLRRSPGFVTVAALSLAIGIGANAAVAGAMALVIARPLPFPHADRLVTIRTYRADNPSQALSASIPEFQAWRQRSRTLEAVGASRSGPRSIGTAPDAPADRVPGQSFTPALFDILGVRPAAGALFVPTTNPFSKDALVVVISHRLWQRRFGAAPDTLGRTMIVDGARRVIVGIMAPDFRYQDDNVELWVPLVLAPGATPQRPDVRQLNVAARLTPGATVADAQAELDAIAREVAAASPALAGTRVRVTPMRDALYGWTKPRLLTLGVAVVTVLLLTCANIAALLLARGASRQREVAMRLSLGATRGRVVRQLLAESLLIGVLSGAAGLLVARAGLIGLTAALGPPPGLPRLGSLAIDPWIAALVLGLAIGSSILFGWLPARAAARLDPRTALHGAAAMARAASRTPRWRGALIVAQVAAAEVLVVGAVLLAISFVRLSGRDLNFDPRGLLSFSYSIRAGEFARDVSRAAGSREFEINPAASQTIARVYARLRALPGAQAVGGISYPPVNSLTLPMTNVRTVDRFPPSSSSAHPAAYFLVTPHAFSTLKTPLVAGREFGDEDTTASAWGVVVNEALARLCWPGENPIGKRVVLEADGDGAVRQVIGLVADIPTRLNLPDPQPVVYASFQQQPSRFRGDAVPMFGEMTFLVRHSGDAAPILAAARQAVAEITPDRAFADVGTVDAHRWARLRESRTYVAAVGAFALASAALAVIGIYGVMAYAVTGRSGEIAVRRALGARGRDVVVAVGRPALTLVCIGLLFGIGAALALTGLLAPQLWGIGPRDPGAFAGVSAALMGAGVLSCVVPLARALAVDPAERLRCE